MGMLRGSPAVCPPDRHCSRWARVYLKFCLCSARDAAALSLGFSSVICWGVAEIPQIMTNYKEKSTEGLSIWFLLTWVLGDLFNLIGCMLEPATLPTQLFVAVLYTATTVILTAQTLYYGHLYHLLKGSRFSIEHTSDAHNQEDSLRNEKLTGYNTADKDFKTNGCHTEVSSHTTTSSPIPVATRSSCRYGSSGRELYYMSARSLTKSHMPTVGSWLAHPRGSGGNLPIPDSPHPSREPLLGGLVATHSAPHLNIKNTLCVVSSLAFSLGIYGLHHSMSNTFHASPPGTIILIGRRLLQDKFTESSMQEGEGSSEIGNWLGWIMAVIYLGGRLPQIWLNMKRGNAEGLNPLMFIFALFGNATYVGSILVKSLEWSRIRPNLPWLVDAGGCVFLDAFIDSTHPHTYTKSRSDREGDLGFIDACRRILPPIHTRIVEIITQFAYFHYRKPKDSQNRKDRYVPA